MFRSKIKVILLSGSLFVLLTTLTSGCLLLRYSPDNENSVGLFKIAYNISFGKKTFFRFYSPVRENERGYIPKEVNQFLIQKIENTNDESELSALIDFYALQANGYRIGYLFHISEQAKIKVASQLVKELANEENLGGKLMMLEEIRTGKLLGKGSYSIEVVNQPEFSTVEEYGKWFDEQAAPIVKTKYQEWWNSNLSWEEKKKINPLEGTNIKVSHCCG